MNDFEFRVADGREAEGAGEVVKVIEIVASIRAAYRLPLTPDYWILTTDYFCYIYIDLLIGSY